MLCIKPEIADKLIKKLQDREIKIEEIYGMDGPNTSEGRRAMWDLYRRDDLLHLHLAQLAAICYPRSPEVGAERAWIRTLRLSYSAQASSGTTLTTARALMHLGRRPAALAAA